MIGIKRTLSAVKLIILIRNSLGRVCNERKFVGRDSLAELARFLAQLVNHEVPPVRVTPSKLSSGLLLALVAAVVFFTGSGPAYAQSNTRYFQMALWTDPTLDADTDIRTFFFGQSQPAQGPTVLIGYNTAYDYAVGSAGGVTIDWSRVVAVEVDEPYGFPSSPASLDSSLKLPDGTPACQVSLAGLNAAIAPMDAKLLQRATELHALAPRARFWVNFTRAEANWMATCNKPQAFNRAYIDVISADWTDDGNNNDIATAQPFYSVVAANRPNPKPDQQLALLPGVYHAPVDQQTHLQGFFDYANQTNTDPNTGQLSCNLPLGPRGVTGIFDGCPMWIVVGWISGTVTVGNTTYVGMLDPASALIKKDWETERAIPLAPGLAHQRSPAQLLQPILLLLLQPPPPS
jgi:hypothetical protein